MIPEHLKSQSRLKQKSMPPWWWKEEQQRADLSLSLPPPQLDTPTVTNRTKTIDFNRIHPLGVGTVIHKDCFKNPSSDWLTEFDHAAHKQNGCGTEFFWILPPCGSPAASGKWEKSEINQSSKYNAAVQSLHDIREARGRWQNAARAKGIF